MYIIPWKNHNIKGESEILIQHVGVKEAEEDIDVDDFIGGALRLGGS